MEAVRRAIDPQMPFNFWGISYGTVVGLQYASLFPKYVRTMYLDGVVDHSLFGGEGLIKPASYLQNKAAVDLQNNRTVDLQDKTGSGLLNKTAANLQNHVISSHAIQQAFDSFFRWARPGTQDLWSKHLQRAQQGHLVAAHCWDMNCQRHVSVDDLIKGLLLYVYWPQTWPMLQEAMDGITYHNDASM